MTIEDDITRIDCTILWRAVGAHRYSAAQRTLAKNGWVYIINQDSWIKEARSVPNT